MYEEVRRIEQGIASDPTQAIGSAKELIETTCKTILAERGKPVTDKPEALPLVRCTAEELQLVPSNVPDATKGAETIKKLLGNLLTIERRLRGVPIDVVLLDVGSILLGSSDRLFFASTRGGPRRGRGRRGIGGWRTGGSTRRGWLRGVAARRRG